jgi:hypothetical protein
MPLCYTVQLEQRTREFIRWIILRMLYACRPGAANERIILRVLRSLDFNCELEDVREAINYIQSIGLATARHNRRQGGQARLTALGVAVVEYSIVAPSGIGRPRKLASGKGP